MKGTLKKRVFALPKGEKGLLERWAERKKEEGVGEVKKAEIGFAYEGTVSHGTMRPQDLIPAFLDVLKELDSAAYSQIMANGGVPSYVFDEGDDSEWWSSEEAEYVLEELFDALDECAPEGYYFGSHPGDGSDYGFWRVEEEME